MSESADRPTVGAAIPAADLSSVLSLDTLGALASGGLARWLPEQRWFGAKGTSVTSARVLDLMVLPPTPASDPAVSAVALTRIEVELGDGRVERYQLPLVVRQADAPPPGAIARLEIAGETASWWLSDGARDVELGRRLGAAFADELTYADEAATWRFGVESAADVAPLATEAPTAASGEQSNSSIRFGKRAILKLYRRLEAGEHPDVEVTRYLTRVRGFAYTPPLLGVLRVEDARGGAVVTGMLQALVPHARDAWAEAVKAARAYIGAPGDREPENPFADEIHWLGEITRDMHDALAAERMDVAFTPADAGVEDVAGWVERTRRDALDTLDLLATRRAEDAIPGPAAAIADAVLRRRAEVITDLDAFAGAIGGRPGLRIRHHGDFHLGQVLRDAEGTFWIIDFEGEPARLLAERRERTSALRDVAGMLRSFAYAAATAAAEVGGVGTSSVVEQRLARWERAARDAFLDGYLFAPDAEAALLPEDPDARDRLLALFETEKVFYELAYELNNRPSWAWIPLRGIGRLLGSPQGGPAPR